MLYRIVGLGQISGDKQHLKDFIGALVEAEPHLNTSEGVEAKVRVIQSDHKHICGVQVFSDVILKEVK